MKNREVLLKTDPCDLLCLINRRLSDDYICVVDLLEGRDSKDINDMNECPCFLTEDMNSQKYCRECISNWLNSESKDNHFI